MGKRYAVVGGSGFLGSHIVEALLARGEDHVRVVDLREPALFHDHPSVDFVKVLTGLGFNSELHSFLQLIVLHAEGEHPRPG